MRTEKKFEPEIKVMIRVRRRILGSLAIAPGNIGYFANFHS